MADFRHIVRICGSDVDGTKRVAHSLGRIRGIGINFAQIACRVGNIDPNRVMGSLTDGEASRLEEIVSDPLSHGVTPWMLNRQKDLFGGDSKHMVGSALALATKQDVDFMKRTRTWKGTRHSLGLKVRGQKTRTTGRKGQTVGVTKKAEVPPSG